MEGAAVEMGMMGRFAVRPRRSSGSVVIGTKVGCVVVGRWRASEVEGDDVVGGIGVVEDSEVAMVGGALGFVPRWL
jgi:hypothetical protein